MKKPPAYQMPNMPYVSTVASYFNDQGGASRIGGVAGGRFVQPGQRRVVSGTVTGGTTPQSSLLSSAVNLGGMK